MPCRGEGLLYSKTRKDLINQILIGDAKLLILRFLKYLRWEEYHHNNKGLYHTLRYLYYHRKRNRLGIKLGIEIWDGSFGAGLRIAHAGNIVVNGCAKIGRGCYLHGSNCIGNNGKNNLCPTIGDNVRLGVGAKVLGDIRLADNITVGAGAVVLHSFDEPGITVAGIPAKRVK